MKLAVLGATGMIGRRITAEALARGHVVTALGRHPDNLGIQHQRLRTAPVDVGGAPDAMAAALAGHDAVVSALGPGRDGDPAALVVAARALVAAVPAAGVRRLVVVGGAGSLLVASGQQLVDTPGFPAASKPIALAHRDALDVYRAAREAGKLAGIDWTYVSPAAHIAPGARSGRYRTGTDRLVVDDQGESRISAEDFAVALVDELESPKFTGQRMTVGY